MLCTRGRFPQPEADFTSIFSKSNKFNNPSFVSFKLATDNIYANDCNFRRV